MKCNRSLGNIVLGLIILVFALFPNLVRNGISKWIIVTASVLLIIHELWQKHNRCDMEGMGSMPMKSSSRRKRR